MPESTIETPPFFSCTSSPQSSGKYSLVSSGSVTFSGSVASEISAAALTASPAVLMTVSSSFLTIFTSAGSDAFLTSATRSGTMMTSSAMLSISSEAGSCAGSTTAIIPLSPAAGINVCSGAWWLRMTPVVMAAAAATPTAVRFHHKTTVLCLAALSRPAETPSQTLAGTSSLPSSRMDFIMRSNSFMLFSSNIFQFLYLVLQPCPRPAELCP